MIIALLYVLLLSIFLFEWLFVMGIGSRYISWTPEIISLILLIYVPLKAASEKRLRLPLRYAVLWITYVIHIFLGFAINGESSGPMFAGLRMYLKFVPLFFLPCVYPFGDAAIKRLLRVILLLACCQLPFTIWQRFFGHADRFVGDFAGGSLGYNTSGVLSLFLLTTMSFLMAFFIKKQISLWFLALSLFTVFLPTTINETKITVFFLPLAFIIPIAFSGMHGLGTFRSVSLLVMLVLCFTLFVSIYNRLIISGTRAELVQFVKKGELTRSYTNRRLIPIIKSLEMSRQDTKAFFFGYGAGNVSTSFSETMIGEYAKPFARYHVGQVSFTQLVWEIGVFGAVIFFLIVLLIFVDSISASTQSGFIGAFSLGMVMCSTVFGLSFFYSATLNQNLFMYIFFLLAGLVVSRRSTSVASTVK